MNLVFAVVSGRRKRATENEILNHSKHRKQICPTANGERRETPIVSEATGVLSDGKAKELIPRVHGISFPLRLFDRCDQR